VKGENVSGSMSRGKGRKEVFHASPLSCRRTKRKGRRGGKEGEFLMPGSDNPGRPLKERGEKTNIGTSSRTTGPKREGRKSILISSPLRKGEEKKSPSQLPFCCRISLSQGKGRMEGEEKKNEQHLVDLVMPSLGQKGDSAFARARQGNLGNGKKKKEESSG